MSIEIIFSHFLVQLRACSQRRRAGVLCVLQTYLACGVSLIHNYCPMRNFSRSWEIKVKKGVKMTSWGVFVPMSLFGLCLFLLLEGSSASPLKGGIQFSKHFDFIWGPPCLAAGIGAFNISLKLLYVSLSAAQLVTGEGFGKH